MEYVVSDIHGNYELLVKLLKKIKFSQNDTLYVLGDVIDKGKDVRKLLDLLFGKLKNNCFVLLGNHEFEFLKYFSNLTYMDLSDEKILIELKKQFEIDSLTIQDVDNLVNLPFFYEDKDFILVHAGISFDDNGNPLSPEKSMHQDLFYSRTFKDEKVIHPEMKCVIFGHTPTVYVGEKGKILKYQKENTVGSNAKDFYKIHIDTGNYLTGILGCLRLDDMQEFYVNEFED